MSGAAAPADRVPGQPPVTLERRGAVAVIWIDSPPVNAIGQAVRQGVMEAITVLDRDPQLTAAVLACAGRTFIAGADIREFDRPPEPPTLPEVVNRIEAADKPVVAALHGTALGGGLEVALAAHARVMEADARVGLPEVTLGVIPGAGGTQRLPRLIGVEAAAEIITSGRMVGAEEALQLGLADRVVPAGGDLVALALALAGDLAGRTPVRVGERPVPPLRDRQGLQQLADRLGLAGQEAPLRALEVIQAAASHDLASGMAIERAVFLELRGSAQARSLRHIFFAEREAARPAFMDGAAVWPVARAHVIGEDEPAVARLGQVLAKAEMQDGGLEVEFHETGRTREDGAFQFQVRVGVPQGPLVDLVIDQAFTRAVLHARPGAPPAALATVQALLRAARLSGLPMAEDHGLLAERMRAAVARVAPQARGPGAALTGPRAAAVMAALANVAAHGLEQGLVRRPLEADVIAVHALGAPRWVGGPMIAGEIHGWDRVLAEVQVQHGAGQGEPPADLLGRLARGEVTVAELNRAT